MTYRNLILGYSALALAAAMPPRLQADTSAGTFFVATNGSDRKNPGTETRPFRTISRGLRMMAPGKTLLVKSGIYAESLGSFPGGTSWSIPVTIAAYPGATVTIKPPPGADRALFFAGASTAYVIVKGFTIDASNVNLDAIKITASRSTGAANHIQIANCEVKHAPLQGILVTDGANDNQFLGLDVHDNGTTDLDHGFYISTSRNIVDGSSIYNNAGYGVQIYSSDAPTANGNVVSNNQIHDNARSGQWGSGIILSSGDGNFAINNVLWGNNGGIQVDYGATNSAVYNNTVYGNQGYGIDLGSGSLGAVIANNIVDLSTWADFMDEGSTGTLAYNNLVGVDPLFVDAAAHDFHLRLGSPAIDSGVTLDATRSDISGTPRLLGNGYDLGAYECY